MKVYFIGEASSMSAGARFNSIRAVKGENREEAIKYLSDLFKIVEVPISQLSYKNRRNKKYRTFAFFIKQVKMKKPFAVFHEPRNLLLVNELKLFECCDVGRPEILDLYYDPDTNKLYIRNDRN